MHSMTGDAASLLESVFEIGNCTSVRGCLDAPQKYLVYLSIEDNTSLNHETMITE